MSFNVLSFLGDHGIYFESQRDGWCNITCPLCGDQGTHGGLNMEEGYYHCWRCGASPLPTLIESLLKVSRSVAISILKQYDGGFIAREAHTKEYARSFEVPGDDLRKSHIRYLEEKRGFDAEYLVKQYGLKGTRPNQDAFGMDYGSRVVIPVHDAIGRIIGCQGRDITGRHEVKYMCSPLEKSLADYKDMLYGAHLVKTKQVCVVEGVFDAWRLGPGFVASYGTAMTKPQLRQLLNWEHIFFLFDSETTAQSQAREYGALLTGLGKKVELLELDLGDKDPADMSPTEALHVRRELGFKKDL